MFLEITLTKQAGRVETWWPAEALIQEVELEIGGQRIDKHNATFFRIFNELFRKDDDKAGYDRLVNFTKDEQISDKALTRRFYLPKHDGHNSTPPRASGPCAWETRFDVQGHQPLPSQVLVSAA
jgi:Major capsid protein N-terminus